MVINNTTDSPTDHPAAKETNTDGSTIKNNNDQEKNPKYSATLAKMGEVREENERLKVLLARILKDYQSLQSHFFDILGHQEANKDDVNKIKEQTLPSDHHDCEDDQLLVSLSLGRTSSHDELRRSTEKKIAKDHDDHDKLALALGSASHENVPMKNVIKSSSGNDSFNNQDRQELQDDHGGGATAEMWLPSKALKTAARPSGSTAGDDHDDGISQMSPLKKARVSVRARCDTPTMNDGCQWRKYGQKISKGNPCPRAYYRCTVSPSCPVRKQVQRCAEDMSILITTYEGTHNHPLPISATAMASTTAAAAEMLQSRSTTSSASASQPASLLTTSATSAAPIINDFTPGTSITTNLNPLLIQNSILNRSQQFYFPNTSISTCNSHPTVTLDLTIPNPSSSSYRSAPRYSTTCLSFSSSSSHSLELPIINNTSNGYGFNYGNVMSHARNYQLGSSPLVIHNGSYNKQPYQEASSFNQLPACNSMISTTYASTIHDQQSLMTETIAAATKAITSNPKFQSALAAALTSFAGNGGGGAVGGGGGGV